MFVQIMEGRAADAGRMKSLMDQWNAGLRPGAAGFLGTTGGVTADGRAIAFARFESVAAARANSERPEQGAWWAQMEACYEGEVGFAESDDVELFLDGGSDDAGFVQVMKSDGADRAFVARLDAFFAEHAADWRPDLLGGLRVWCGSVAYDVSYFTSEAEARAGEAKPAPAGMEQFAPEMEGLMAGTEFFDLTDPWLH